MDFAACSHEPMQHVQAQAFSFMLLSFVVGASGDGCLFLSDWTRDGPAWRRAVGGGQRMPQAYTRCPVNRRALAPSGESKHNSRLACIAVAQKVSCFHLELHLPLPPRLPLSFTAVSPCARAGFKASPIFQHILSILIHPIAPCRRAVSSCRSIVWTFTVDP